MLTVNSHLALLSVQRLWISLFVKLKAPISTTQVIYVSFTGVKELANVAKLVISVRYYRVYK